MVVGPERMFLARFDWFLKQIYRRVTALAGYPTLAIESSQGWGNQLE
jgi:hypothetical protein